MATRYSGGRVMTAVMLRDLARMWRAAKANLVIEAKRVHPRDCWTCSQGIKHR